LASRQKPWCSKTTPQGTEHNDTTQCYESNLKLYEHQQENKHGASGSVWNYCCC